MTPEETHDASRDPPPQGRAAHTAGYMSIACWNRLRDDTGHEEFSATLARLARLSGGARLEEQVELNALSLYRALCRRGNSELKTVAALLKALGLRLVIQPITSDTRGPTQLRRRRHPMAPDGAEMP